MTHERGAKHRHFYVTGEGRVLEDRTKIFPFFKYKVKSKILQKLFRPMYVGSPSICLNNSFKWFLFHKFV